MVSNLLIPSAKMIMATCKNNALYCYCLIALLLIASLPSCAAAQVKTVNVKTYGAKADGKHDDSGAFYAAIMAGSKIIIPPGTYLLNKQLVFRNVANKTIEATGATMINNDNTNSIIFFESCSHITFQGGRWTRLKAPAAIGPSGQEHAIVISYTDHVLINKVTVDHSPQMGVDMMNVINATVSNCYIHHCFRDGIYAHYSVNVSYLNNRLDNIKDDAMSIHDYGLAEQKDYMHKFGYTQAGHGVVKNNVVTNCYEGFSSIGCNDILVAGNTIKNTVNAGISVFNSENVFKGSTARAKNITIINNTLLNTCGTQTIMQKQYKNDGQFSTGRCAIYLAVHDENNSMQHPKSRMQNFIVKNNKVTNSFTEGLYMAQIDKAIIQGNTFIGCKNSGGAYGMQTIEINNCTGVTSIKNVVKN